MKKITLLFLLVVLAQSNFSQRAKKDELNPKYKVEKLSINTILSEITTQVKGDYLYVYRNKPFYKTHSEYYDLYKIKVDKEKVLSRFKKLDNDLNTRFNEGPVSFDKKNKLVYVTRNVYTKAQLKLKRLAENPLEIDIYNEVGDTFLFKKKFVHNDSTTSVGHACYSELTHRLYFSSKMKGRKGLRPRGGSDLYYCDVLPNGEYGEPINLGKKINTRKDELFTMVNRGVLFFSTAGFQRGSRKDLDIYYITEMGLLKGQKPKKLDMPVNSLQDDFGITFIDGQRGYFSSNRGNKQDYNHDIYYFDLGEPIVGDDEFSLLLATQDERRKKLTNSNFKVVNHKTRHELEKFVVEEGIIIEHLRENEKYDILFDETLNLVDVEIGPYTKANPADVFLKDSIDLRDKVPVIVEVVDSTSLLSTIEEMQDWFSKNEEKIKNDSSSSTSSFALSNIYFEYDKAAISPKSSEILTTLAEYLKLNTKIKLKIFAHSDSRGDAGYNLLLSDKRANSVYQFLVDKGVTSERVIEKKGLGETQLIETCTECTEEQHERNRRVEFAIVN